MTSAQGALPVISVLIALFCIPPILSLRACVKRAGHVRRRGGRAVWPIVGIAVSAASLVFNLGVVGLAVVALGDGGTELGRRHALALGLSWLCFWLWLFVAVALKRRRRKMVY
ncbi:hypothetical protein [Defluviimonas sp. SAOS-178_SWC]|uniref:hypothetical protein n=1 Tax=Defluviimonas sp. SAOS-178_SWC TaxID=3121287 RepID=UPI0032222293